MALHSSFNPSGKRFSSMTRTQLFRTISRSISVLLLPFVIGSCVSPTSPDTPRIRIEDEPLVVPPKKSERIFYKSWTFTVKETGSTWKHSIVDTSAVIDTSVSAPALWCSFRLKRLLPPQRFPYLEEMEVRFDSLRCDGSSRTLQGDPSTGFGAKFKICTGKDSTGSPILTVVTANPQTSSTVLSIQQDKTLQELRGQVQTNIVVPARMTIDAQFIIKY